MQVFDDRHGDGVTPNNAFLEENLDTIDQWMALFQAFKKTRVSIILLNESVFMEFTDYKVSVLYFARCMKS